MAYTPINWATGDTITADKLNKMDNGWSVESTQLFSETVTTVEQDGIYTTMLAYSQLINADTITVVFDGTEYTCPSIDIGTYGAPWSDNLNAYDFSEFPFNLYADDGFASLSTQTAGSHTIAVSTEAIEASVDFAKAVSATIGGAFYLFVYGTTTWAQVVDAMAAGKLVFRTWAYAYEDVTFDDQYAGLELVTDAYVSSHGDYAVSAIVTEKGVQSVTRYTASSVDGVLQ